jgi:hypothetical protein
MRTKFHLVANLIDVGLPEDRAAEIAEAAFTDASPQAWIRDELKRVTEEIQAQTVYMNALRAVADGTVNGHLLASEAIVR